MICPQVLRHKHTFMSYYENPTGRGYFYQMSNVYTCIAYLIEILTFCSKNLVHKGVNFDAQNALKLTYEHL